MKKNRCSIIPYEGWKKLFLMVSISTVLLFAELMQVSATVYSQQTRLNLKLEDVSVESVLKTIEDQSGFYFLYRSDILKKIPNVSLDMKEALLEVVLDKIIVPYGFGYEIDDRVVVIKKVEAKSTEKKSLQDGKTIAGTVESAKGMPIPGASVFIKGTTIGTVTDENGMFELRIPENAETLVISFVGMKKQEIGIGDKTRFSITLKPESVDIEEVVAVGYGTMKKSDLTGSIVSVGPDEITKMPSTRIDEALQGKVTGVVISNDKAQPGADPVIRIRGSSSIVGNNDPLVVIDGLLGAQLSSLDPNEIASVEILKDASATAIYGSQGANGVILITTKRGKAGETKFDFNSYLGFSELTNQLEMMSAEEQINFLKEVPDDHQNYRLYQDFLQIYDPPAVDTDWQDVVFRVGIMRNHHLAARGGNEKTRFSISGSILSQDGIIESTGYDRQTFRANFDQKVTDRLSFGVNLNMSRTVQDNSRVDQPEGSWGKAITTTAMKFSPAIPVYDENGNYSAPYPPGESIDNPMALIKEQINTNTGFSMHMQAFAEYEIIKDLRFRTSYNYKFSNFKNDRWTGKDLLDASGIGKAGVSYSNTNTWLSDNILTYNKEFGIHKLTVMGGYSESGFNSPSLSAGGNTFPTESLKYYALELADPATYSINTGYTDSRLISFLGRINYVLRNKYLVTVNFRADGSSKFAKNNKWGYFPSGAFGWRISEEEFMTAVPQISNFKLRISYGETGSQAISPYQSLASYASTITNLGQNAYTAIFLDNIPNPYLRWETTEQQNIGLDLGLFRNRLNLVADYYIKNTYDLLYTKQIPSYTGYDSQVQNIGNVRNKGIELSLSTVNLDGVFKWSSSFNISFNKNEVLDLGGDQFTLYSGAPTGSSLFSQTSILKIGEPMGSFYGYVFDGIYQNEEECAALPYPTAADCEPGMIKLKDIADEEGDMVPDGKITPEDRTVIGNSHPDFTFGFGNSFSFKGFDMNIMFQGIYGNQIMNLHRASLENIGTLNGLKSMIGAFWDGEGSTNEVQAYEFGQGPPSSRWLEDGSYLRLKNIALGYTFNKSLLENSGIDRLRIYISGTNLWTLTNYSGFDPEIDSNAYASKGDILKGYDYGGYPTAKTYTVGINLSF